MATEDCRLRNVTEEDVADWLYTPAENIIITIILPIFLGLGLIGNSSFLFVIYRIPKMRSASNIYLAHLALSDLLFLIMSTVRYFRKYSQSILRYNEPFANSAACSIFFTVGNTGYFAAILFVTLVSFERYLALCHPMKHLKIRGRRRTKRLVALGWLAGFAISVLVVPSFAILRRMCLLWPDGNEYLGLPLTLSYCDAVNPLIPKIFLPLLDFPWIITMVANIYMYARIIRVLNKRMGTDGMAEDDQKAQKIRNQVAKMLIVNGVVFFICNIPYRVLNLSWWICYIAEIPNPLYAALGTAGWYWLPVIPQLINTIINPVIYGVMNAHYRQALIRVFCCKTKPGPTVNQTETSVVQISNYDNKTFNDTKL